MQLIAVSKKQDAEKVRAAFDAGQPIFGESKVQEARAKIPLLPSAVRWHFIGHLQKNKIRHALPLFEMFHSIDSLALAQDVQRIADEEGVRPRVLLEVNVAGEGSKFGFAPEKLKEEMEALLAAWAAGDRRRDDDSAVRAGRRGIAPLFRATSRTAR